MRLIFQQTAKILTYSQILFEYHAGTEYAKAFYIWWSADFLLQHALLYNELILLHQATIMYMFDRNIFNQKIVNCN